MAPTADGYERMLNKPKSWSPYVSKPTSSSSPIFSKSSRPAGTAGMTSISNAPAPSGGGGGGGGGGGYGGGGGIGTFAAPAPPPPPRRSLADVIASDFSLGQLRGEAARRESEFDMETGRLRGETERDQELQRGDLAEDLEQMSLDSSEDLAGRGLLNSGGLFVQQDEINADGERRESAIADLLTRLLTERGQGRTALQAQNRTLLNDRIAKIGDDYQAGVGGY
jgi:hypothetical protein